MNRSILRLIFRKSPRTNMSSHSSMLMIPPPDSATHDNPCWGSPDACSLKDLLRNYSNLIIYDSGDYIGLNKPPDCRMDGPHAATVLKLVTHLYPTQRLQKAFPDESQRLDFILKNVHQYGDCHRKLDDQTKSSDNDEPLRPCHQLDYATSGVLWIARTAAAANRARKALEERRVSKTYIALVHGHVILSPELPMYDQVGAWLQQTETNYRKQRSGVSLMGSLPPHSLFQLWKTQQLQKEQPARNSKRIRREPVLGKDEWKQLWNPLNLHLSNQPKGLKENLLQVDWKTVKKEHAGLMPYFEKVSEAYNNQLAKQRAKQADDGDASQEIPIIFRTPEESNTLFVAVPIGQHENEFPMRIPPTFHEIATNDTKANLQVGDTGMDYKPSLTRCTVLQRGLFDGEPVTKVLLEPRTGRRHQLRVHMALLGYPIVGDLTYCSYQNERAGRMCLHSHRLQVSDPLLDMKAPDPFSLDEDIKE